MLFPLIIQITADLAPTNVFSASYTLTPSLVPSPSADAKKEEKQITLIVILSVAAALIILLTVVCCARRTQIQKAEGPVRPVTNAQLTPAWETAPISDGGSLLPGKLKYAQFEI
jgi:hypothetical protein